MVTRNTCCKSRYKLICKIPTTMRGCERSILRGGNYEIAKGKGTSSLNAVKDAVKRSGTDKGIEIGGTLALEYSGEAPKSKSGFNAAKLYTAEYSPPSYGVDLNDMA